MKYKSDKYSVSVGKNIIAQLYVGGTLNGNNELRIKQGMPRDEVIKKIIEDCPQFAKQFDKQKETIYSKYGVEKSNRSHEVILESSFGKLYISSEHSPRIKVASLHSRLEGNAESFKDILGYDINTYNGKCNFYSADPQYILDTLDEYLNNIRHYDTHFSRTYSN